MVEAKGGTLLSGVTKELNYVVMEDPNSGSSKAQKAASSSRFVSLRPTGP